MDVPPVVFTKDGRWEVSRGVRGIQIDSRRIAPGDVFVAVPGQTADGHEFVEDAALRGALAAVVERPVSTSIPTVLVPSSREAAATLSAHIYGHPSRSLVVTGVTGTNGKTSVVFWLRHLLRIAGRQVGMLSSVLNVTGREDRQEAWLTTPEAPDVQRGLAEMRDNHFDSAVIEVSSHGLVQHRVDAIGFDVAILTNITREHLDYHGSMSAYIGAKAILFTKLLKDSGTAVFNADDPYVEQIKDQVNMRKITYGLARGDVRARILEERPWSTVVEILGTGSTRPIVTIPTPGRYNVYNFLAALAGALVQGIDVERWLPSLEGLPEVPGRLEVAAKGDDILVVVDYAHTPDGLTQILQTVRRLASPTGHVWLVFGARGGRDRGKRPVMGAIAARLADRVILTADSPYGERAQDIARDLEVGIREMGSTPFATELDRRQAIDLAVRNARTGDVVVITGRGPEPYQVFGTEQVTMLDAEAARAAMQARLQHGAPAR